MKNRIMIDLTELTNPKDNICEVIVKLPTYTKTFPSARCDITFEEHIDNKPIYDNHGAIVAQWLNKIWYDGKFKIEPLMEKR